MRAQKKLIICLFLFSCLGADAQIFFTNPGSALFEQFKRNKLYIVLTGDQELDNSLQEAFKNNWTVTRVAGTISKKEMGKMINDTAASFFFYREWSIKFYKDTYYPEKGFYIINGGKKKLSKYDINEDVVYEAPLDGTAYEYNKKNVQYRLPLIIHTINTYFVSGKKFEQVAHVLDKKILLINKVYFDEKSNNCFKSDALTAYKHKYEILPEERIDELIKKGDGQYALLVPIETIRGRSIFIYDLGTRDIIVNHGGKKSPFIRKWVQAEDFMYLNDCRK